MSAPRSTITQVHFNDAILAARGISTDKAYFAFDSANLLDKDVQPLRDVAKLDVGTTCWKVHQTGRASRSASEYNMVLGESRADQVARFLAQGGLSKERMSTTSRGAMDAKGTNEATWAADRRVDVILEHRPI